MQTKRLMNSKRCLSCASAHEYVHKSLLILLHEVTMRFFLILFFYYFWMGENKYFNLNRFNFTYKNREDSRIKSITYHIHLLGLIEKREEYVFLFSLNKVFTFTNDHFIQFDIDFFSFAISINFMVKLSIIFFFFFPHPFWVWMKKKERNEVVSLTSRFTDCCKINFDVLFK